MANTKISALTSATTPLAGTEVLPIVQSGVTVKVANNDLRPKQIQSNATSGVLQIAGPAASSTRVMTTPDANFTAARTDAAQSFTGDQTLSTGNLVQGTAAKGINFTANSTSTGSTSQLLNYYEEITAASTACTGAITTAVSWKATRVGKVVNLTLPATFGTATTATYFEYGVVLPTAFRPAASIGFACQIKDADANSAVPGLIFVLTTGAIRVYKDMTAATNFTTGLTAGLGQSIGTAISWTI